MKALVLFAVSLFSVNAIASDSPWSEYYVRCAVAETGGTHKLQISKEAPFESSHPWVVKHQPQSNAGVSPIRAQVTVQKEVGFDRVLRFESNAGNIEKETKVHAVKMKISADDNIGVDYTTCAAIEVKELEVYLMCHEIRTRNVLPK